MGWFVPMPTYNHLRRYVPYLTLRWYRDDSRHVIAALSDGASAMPIVMCCKSQRLVTARIGMAVTGCDAAITCGVYGPVPAAQKALKRAGMSIDDMQTIET